MWTSTRWTKKMNKKANDLANLFGVKSNDSVVFMCVFACYSRAWLGVHIDYKTRGAVGEKEKRKDDFGCCTCSSAEKSMAQSFLFGK
jgi:hypothetical protein